MPSALVLGSEGNIGRPLVRYLQTNGYDVLELDIRPHDRPGYLTVDINQPVDLLPAFDWGPDVVFTLSAIVSRVALRTGQRPGHRDQPGWHQQCHAAVQADGCEARVLLEFGGLRARMRPNGRGGVGSEAEQSVRPIEATGRVAR